MGQILSQPVTDKHSKEGSDKYVSYGLSSMQGWRINMEDAHSTVLNVHKDNTSDNLDSNENTEHVSLFGVYDGHGGEKAALFVGEHLQEIIRSTEAFNKGDYINAFKEGFLSCDQAILQDYDMKDDDSGCAATAALITPTKIICGNAGDSRTIMSINGYAKALSYDHKPSNEGEKARICSAGGYVDMGRVNGNLALSRGIGDFEFKKNPDLPAEEQIVTCYPDVIQHGINYDKDEFLVVACDGIWDCLTSQNCVECVRRGIYERKPFTTICEEIMELCCAPTSDGSGIGCDNMSIIIVALLDVTKNETLDQWYEKIISRIELAQNNPDNKEYGPISAEYLDIYKEMYGEYYEIGQQAQNNTSRGGGAGGPSMFGGLSGLRTGGGFGRYGDEQEEEDGVVENGQDQANLANGAVSLQNLLASNAITNENGVIYLDTSSAQSLLAHFGMSGEDVEDIDDTHDKHVEEVEDEDETKDGKN